MKRILHVLGAVASLLAASLPAGTALAQSATGPCGQFKITNEVSAPGKKMISVDILFGNQWLKTRPIAMKFGEQAQTAVQFPDTAGCTMAYNVLVDQQVYGTGITNFCSLIRFRVLPTGAEPMLDTTGASCPGG